MCRLVGLARGARYERAEAYAGSTAKATSRFLLVMNKNAFPPRHHLWIEEGELCDETTMKGEQTGLFVRHTGCMRGKDTLYFWPCNVGVSRVSRVSRRTR